jgi:hypothetical protein
MSRSLAMPASIVKAAAHVHSEWSDDASWSLSRIAQTFGRRGYGVVLMCEHSRGFSAAKWDDYWAECARASTERVLLVPGIEYGDCDDVVHIPVWGRVPFYGEEPAIGDLLLQARADGGTAVWAHPSRRDAWQHFDPSWRDHLSAIEVWNRKYDGFAPGPAKYSPSAGRDVADFVSLDFHNRRQLFPLSMRLQLEAQGDPSAFGGEAGRPNLDSVFTGLRGRAFAPHAFGLPLSVFTTAPVSGALRTAELIRRQLARALH